MTEPLGSGKTMVVAARGPVPIRSASLSRDDALVLGTVMGGKIWLRKPQGSWSQAWAASSPDVAPGKIQLSPRLLDRLALEPADEIVVQAPRAHDLTVGYARARDIPGDPLAVHVSATTARNLRKPWRRWALLVSDGVAMPVIVRADESGTDERRVRVPMYLRELLSTTGASVIDQDVVLQSLAPPRMGLRAGVARARAGFATTRRLRAVRRRFRALLRFVPSVFEHLLRALLNAPVTGMRTVESWVGDDSHRAVRLDASSFALLGITEGDQVLVSWGARRRVAMRALLLPSVEHDDDAAHDSAQAAARRLTGVPHLMIGLPAPARAELDIPRDAIVAVRRRLLPLALKRLNEAVLPLLAVLAGVLALQSQVPLPVAAAATLVILVLELLPLRVAR